MLKRNWVLDNIRTVFQNYGYEPLGTPAFESWDMLKIKSGADAINQIYYFKDKSNRELGLRFEWTTSLARYVASRRDLPKPFKRYVIGPVWRYEKPSEKRFREFYQADVDIVGVKDPIADAEVLAVAVDCFKKIGFEGFVIRLNDRRLLDAFVEITGINNVNSHFVYRIIDKYEKIGENGVYDELNKLGVSENKISNLLDVISVKGEPIKILGNIINKLISNFKDDNKYVNEIQYYEILNKLNRFNDENNNIAINDLQLFMQDISVLTEYYKISQNKMDIIAADDDLILLNGLKACFVLLSICNYLEEFNIMSKIIIDLRLARGLDYYTGPVFEVFAEGYEYMGSIAGGGRYDTIVESFGGQQTPMTGISLGIERIVPLLEKIGVFVNKKLETQVFVVTASKKSLSQAMKIVQILRRVDISADFDHLSRGYRKQINVAIRRGVQFILTVGERELDTDYVTIQDMSSRVQEPMSIQDFISKIKNT